MSGRQWQKTLRASEAPARGRNRARELPRGRSARGLAHAGSGRAFVAGHEIRPGLRLNQAGRPAGNFPVQLTARRLHNRTRRAPPLSLQVRSRAGRQIDTAQSACGAAGSSPSRSAVLRGQRTRAKHPLAPINFAWPSAHSLPCKPRPLPGTPRRAFFRPHSQFALSLRVSFGQRVTTDPGVLTSNPLAVHEGCGPSRGSAGSQVQPAGKRAVLPAGWAEPGSPGESVHPGEARGVSPPCKLRAASSGLGVEGGRWPLEAGITVPLHSWQGRCCSNQWSEQKVRRGSGGYWQVLGRRGFLGAPPARSTK